ncbi:MAG: Prefoldin subunit alpha [Promethearchaeota archaeon]|nr:MAG: Prefoldin subunit alpha [Candidatus Lokiarchaeota archaeon]
MENNQNAPSQALAYEFQALRERKAMYEQNLDLIYASLNNLNNTKETVQNLKDVEEEDEILIPVGGIVNLKAKIKDPQKILLSVSDVVIEKNIDTSLEFIDKLIDQHREQIKFLNEQLQQIEGRLQGISQIFRQGTIPQS